MSETKTRMSGAERREQILNTACQLFADYGYDNVSTKQLAAAVNCSEALLYKYFSSKEDIMEELFQEWDAQQKEPIILTIINNSALETLKAYYESFYKKSWDRSTATGHRARLGAAIHNQPAFRKKSIEAIAKGSDIAADTLMPVIQFGQSIGEIREGDAYAMAQLFSTYIAGVDTLVNIFGEYYQILDFEKIKALLFV